MASDKLHASLQERNERINPVWKWYAQHRRDARSRKIPFFLSFEEWLAIWVKSGKFEKRGVYKGQYVMARFGDKGPYSKDNVSIISCEQNHRDGNVGRIRSFSEQHKRNLSEAHKGKKLTREHKDKISRSLRGRTARPFTQKHRDNIARARRKWAALQPTKLCLRKKCNKKHYAKGMCEMHYAQSRRIEAVS